jgi:transcriptional regulator with XRE-family HTH domain
MTFKSFLLQVGRNIKAVRIRRGLRQVDVEERTGIDYKYYQEIESGRVNVTLKTLYRLAKLFRVKISEFFRMFD